MSQIVLYFLHSTLVFSFNIDVVLTLSMGLFYWQRLVKPVFGFKTEYFEENQPWQRLVKPVFGFKTEYFEDNQPCYNSTEMR